MMTLYLLLAMLCWLIITFYHAYHVNKISKISDLALSDLQPSVAIIFAVRNEERDLELALQSLANIKYANFKIIAVDDRSTDGTVQILQEISAANPKVKLVRVCQLPDGWLGKNHALYQGYLSSSEDWLLFTDADVIFSKDVLKKAVGFASQKNLDHLAVFPDVKSRSILLNSVLKSFEIMLDLKLKPWQVKNKQSEAFIGMGAFNLVRRETYELIGTHESIKMRPDDDLQLGKKIKRSGARQDVLYGINEVCLEWYHSLGEFTQGLMKNTFAGLNYNIFQAFLSVLGVVILFILPFIITVFSFSWVHFFIYLGLLASQWMLFLLKPGNCEWWHFLMMPFAGVVMAYVIIKATVSTLYNKGITWSGNFYRLNDLKKG